MHKFLNALHAFALSVLLISVFNPQTSLAAQQTNSAIGFSVLHTSTSSPTPEALVVDSGSWFTLRQLVHGAVLIQHPRGDVLVDTGLGTDIDAQFEENTFINRILFRYGEVTPVIEQLKAQDYDMARLSRILPTHLHWDHASGLEDFPGVPVWVREEEYQHAINGRAPAHLRSQIDSPTIDWHFFELSTQAYAGFERSLDLYKDGSIILVDLAGHSAGQIGIFLTVDSGQRYFFIGDTTWTIKGVHDNAGRPALLEELAKVDWQKNRNEAHITHIHQQQEMNQSLIIVPAHDEKVMAKLPRYPEFRY